MLPLAAIAAAAVLGLGTAITIAIASAAHAPRAPSIALSPGGLYRITFAIDPALVTALRSGAPQGASPQAYAESELSAALEAAGFRPVLAMVQDASGDGRLWDVVARWEPSPAHPTPRSLSPQIEFLDAAPVLSAGLDASSPIDAPASLDAGMSSGEIDAVRYALAREHDAGNLRAFAGTLAPDFPAAASLLFAKATLIDAVAPLLASGPTPLPARALQALAARVEDLGDAVSASLVPGALMAPPTEDDVRERLRLAPLSDPLHLPRALDAARRAIEASGDPVDKQAVEYARALAHLRAHPALLAEPPARLAKDATVCPAVAFAAIASSSLLPDSQIVIVDPVASAAVRPPRALPKAALSLLERSLASAPPPVMQAKRDEKHADTGY